MSHWIGRGEKQLFVDNEGRAWDSPGKNFEYSPETFEVMSEQPFKDYDILPEKTGYECHICGYQCGSLTGIKKHYFMVHKTTYEENK